MDHLNRYGVGLLLAPAEAHWIMGYEKGVPSALNVLIQCEGNKLAIDELYMLAAGAMNSHVVPSGFSPYQWVFGAGGAVLDDERLLPGIEPAKAFKVIDP